MPSKFWPNELCGWGKTGRGVAVRDAARVDFDMDFT